MMNAILVSMWFYFIYYKYISLEKFSIHLKKYKDIILVMTKKIYYSASTNFNISGRSFHIVFWI